MAENVPLLLVENGETALTILSAIITSLISMMVLVFSMVMLLLSMASSNYSPRLLPGLISDKTHQLILGIYLGTILYCIFVLFSRRPAIDRFEISGFSVLMGILLTVFCIYTFIYFIHNISEKIQISKILDRIYLVAKSRLSSLIQDETQLMGLITLLNYLHSSFRKRTIIVSPAIMLFLLNSKTVNFEDLLYNVMAAIRTYCSHDIIIIQKLAVMFKYLQLQEDVQENHMEIIRKEIDTLLENARKVLENSRDLEKLAEIERYLITSRLKSD